MTRMVYHEQLPFYVHKWDITGNDLVLIDELEHICVRSADDGHYFSRHGARSPTAPDFLSHLEIDKRMRAGRLSIEIDGLLPQKQELARAHARLPLDMIAERKRPRVEYLLAMIEGFEFLQKNARLANGRRITLSEVPLEEVLPGLHEEVLRKGSPELFKAVREERVWRPDPRSFMRHLKVFNDNYRDPLALAAKHGGPGKRDDTDIGDSVRVWVEHVNAFANSKKPPPTTVRNAIVGQITAMNRVRTGDLLVSPSIAVVKRMLDALSAYHVLAGQEGPEFARKHFQPSVGGMMVERAGQRVEMDEWRTDLLTILEATRYLHTYPRRDRRRLKKVRIWVTAIIDVATRCVLALQFSLAPSAATALRAVEMMTMDKTEYGETMGARTPWHQRCGAKTFVTDQGSSFMSFEVRMALGMMGCTFAVPTAGQSEKRPFIETLFKTLKTYLRHLDGQTFASIWERADYDPVANAAATVDFLNVYVVRAVVDIYHNHDHDNMLSESPQVRWTRLTDAKRAVPPPGEALRRNIFGEKDTRVVDENGILVLGIRYTCPNLMNWFINKGGISRRGLRAPLEVDIRIDRHSMNAISYFDTTVNQWIPALNTCNLPERVSAAELIETGRRLLKRNTKDRELNSLIYWETFNDLRLSGEAAAAKAEIGDQRVDIEYIRSQERQLAHVFEGGLRERRSIDLVPAGRLADVLKADVYDRAHLVAKYLEVDDSEPLNGDADDRRGTKVKAKVARRPATSKNDRTAPLAVGYEGEDDESE